MQPSVLHGSCDGFYSLSEANNSDGKYTWPPINLKKVWQRPKDDPSQQQISLSIEEVSPCSSVVQILPKPDPPSKCQDQEKETDAESVSQPLNSEKNEQLEADDKEDAVPTNEKKVKHKRMCIGKYC